MATTVLGLKTFAASDPVDYNEINDNYVKIDNGVKTAMQARAAHNLLDNSDFTNPVNQRGQSSYSGTGGKVYTIDRWHTWSASISVSVQSGYLSVTNSTDSIYQNISQIIDKHNLTNKAATIAVWDAAGNVYCASGVISTNNEISCNTPTDFWFSATLKDDNTIYFAIRPRGAKTANIKAAALYEGSYDASTLPAYQPKGYAAELAECQRYYYKVPSSYLFTISGYCATHTSARLTIPTPVPMRVNPSVTIDDISAVRILTANGAFVPTAISFGARESNGIAIFMESSGMTPWTCCTARFSTNVSLSADL